MEFCSICSLPRVSLLQILALVEASLSLSGRELAVFRLRLVHPRLRARRAEAREKRERVSWTRAGVSEDSSTRSFKLPGLSFSL
jgi:hypothetical protein